MKLHSSGLYLLWMVLASSLLAGCLGNETVGPGAEPSPGETLFKYIPSDGLASVGYYSINEDGLSELRGYTGSSFFSSGIIREISGVEAVSGTYNDNETVVAGMISTKRTAKDLIDAFGDYPGAFPVSGSYMPGYDPYGTGTKSLDYDERSANGKTVYVIYSGSSSSSRKLPVFCLWDENGKIGFIYVNTPYSYYSDRYAPPRSCFDAFKYAESNGRASEMLKKSDVFAKGLPSGGVFVGQVRGGSESSGIAMAGYVDDDAFYGYVYGNSSDATEPGFLSQLGFLNSLGMKNGQYLCFGGHYGSATIIEKNGRSACRSGGPYSGGSFWLVRASTNGNFLVFAEAPKGWRSAGESALQKIEELAFSMDIGGQDVKWKNSIEFTIVAYEEDDGTDYGYGSSAGRAGATPLAEARAELYVKGGTSGDYAGTETVEELRPYPDDSAYGKLVATKYTGKDGTVTFSDVPLTGATIIVSKEGYYQSGGYSKNATVYVSSYSAKEKVYFVKSVPKTLLVRVYEVEPGDDSYNDLDAIGRIENATVRLYEYSGYGASDEPLSVNITNSDGEVLLYNAPLTGRVVVSKTGYSGKSGDKVETVYFYQRDVKVKAYLARIAPKNVTVRVYEVEGDGYSSDAIGRVEGALVKAFDYHASSYNSYDDEPLAMNYTNANGEAVLYNLPLTGRVVVNKTGYEDRSGYKDASVYYYATDKRVSVYLRRFGARDLRVNVYAVEKQAYDADAYIEVPYLRYPTSGNPLPGALVKLYDYSSRGTGSKIAENTTDSSGSAMFYGVPSTGSVVVTKDGYWNQYGTGTRTYFYSTNKKIDVYMTPE